MTTSTILRTGALGFPWETPDPFLFCVHHLDRYPAGNADFGPAASLAGRDLGQDFMLRDGWRMYHGEVVPGFPAHPHRGFETVTVVRQGLVDHADSLGAAARYGNGDVQWLTAGRGIQHSEMFPLLDPAQGNTLELFQIWLNLPAADKFADPHFAMFWAHEVPRAGAVDGVEITVVAGALGDARPPAPPPRSWAARRDSDVAIWTVRMAPGARAQLPPAQPGSNRRLYWFAGDALRVNGEALPGHCFVDVRPERALALEGGGGATELLVLQGRPIAEPVAQYGPFVMNHAAEVQQAFADYRRSQFGGWPWTRPDPVHGADPARFARHADGRREEPASKTAPAA